MAQVSEKKLSVFFKKTSALTYFFLTSSVDFDPKYESDFVSIGSMSLSLNTSGRTAG